MTGRTTKGVGLRTVLRGGAALLTLIILVAGLPIALQRLGGDPLPRNVPAWHRVSELLLHRDNGAVFLGTVRDLSWLAWAAFTAAVAVETQAAFRRRRAPRLRLGGLQHAAGWLVAVAALAFSSQPAAVLASAAPATVTAVAAAPAAGPPAAPAAGPPAALPADPRADASAADPSAHKVMSMGFYQMVTVRSGDCLWTIAQHYLGNGDLYPEIVRLNLGHPMGDGQRFTDPSIIWPGWVLQLPAVAHPPGPVAHDPAGTQHRGHDSGDARFGSPHAAACGSGPAADTVPAPGRTSPGHPAAEHPAPAAAVPAGATGTSAGPAAAPAQAPDAGAASAPAGAALAEHGQIPPLALFGAGMLAGGATVTLARMRRRQRQSRRPGRRIPLPASAPVIAAERRLRAAALSYPGWDPEAESLHAGAAQAYLYAGGPEPESLHAGAAPWAEPYRYAGHEAEPRRYSGPGLVPGTLPQPATALRAALSQLGSALASAGQPMPDVTAVRVRRSGMELLLASPSSEPPPAPFAVPGGRLGMAWRLELPRYAPAKPFPPADTGDLLPGLLTAGIAEDGGFLLIDLEYLRVTTVDGPADLAGLVLATAAAELTTSQLAGWYDLILAGFPELEAVDGRGTSCASLDEALDLLAAKAVALRRRLGDADGADVRRLRLLDPGDEDWALTLLVSRTVPTVTQLAMLLDLASDPGGIAALVPGGTDAPEGHPVPASFRLDADHARPGGMVGHVSPLHADVWPQPLTRADYDALASLFATAADLRDVPASEPPYDGSSWPPAPGLTGLEEPPLDDPGLEQPPGLDDLGLDVPPPDDAGVGDPPAALAEEGLPGTAGGAGDPGQDPGHRASLRIGVMGTFTVNGAPAALQPAQSQLILALALNGQDGLSNGQLCYLLGADPDHPKPSDSLRQLIVRTRRQLGRAADGREWIGHLGAGQYALHPESRFDWADFEDLSEQGMQDRDPGCLRGALALIRGKPFTGCYYWWLDLAFTETVRAQIVDAAEMLAEIELAAGDPSASARAARTGLHGDAAAEQLWRAVMRAEHAAGNLAGVREAWSRCLDTMQDIAADGEPHPDTAALYQQLTGGGRAQPAWARSYR
jgi:DNA-binding SARP family transcriptional activator